MDRKDDYEAPDIKVRNILVEADGSVFIACEEYYLIVTTYTSPSGGTATTRTYYYEDIPGAKISAAGKFEWLRKITKNKRAAGAAAPWVLSLSAMPPAIIFYTPVI